MPRKLLGPEYLHLQVCQTALGDLLRQLPGQQRDGGLFSVGLQGWNDGQHESARTKVRPTNSFLVLLLSMAKVSMSSDVQPQGYFARIAKVGGVVTDSGSL